MASITGVAELIRELYEIVARLEGQFPDRRFTPDGHLVGSIGEVLAAHQYNLDLLPASTETHDAQAPNGTLVQIKATQRGQVALRSEPTHLLVLRIHRSGEAEEIYNGPGAAPWDRAGQMGSNGQRDISLSKLRQLMASVAPEARLPLRAT